MLHRFAFILLAAAIGLASQVAPGMAQPVSSNQNTVVPDASALRAAVASPIRNETERARDPFRNPEATLSFWGIRPGMTVMEVAPGGMYWTRILAPYLGTSGKLFLSTVDPDQPVGSGYNTPLSSIISELQARPDVYRQVRLSPFAPWRDDVNVAPDGTADAVIVSRLMHGFIRDNWTTTAIRTYHRALKRGGVLAIEQHRLPDNMVGRVTVNSYYRMSGYVTERQVIRAAEAAGFRLDARSEINANPRDDHDHPQSVWSLPPSLWTVPDGSRTDSSVDTALYRAIGESDRMTLRFVKR